MGDVADFAEMAAALAQAKRFGNPIESWSTGLEDLDRRDVALRSGALTIVLGPSGVGSTILATGFVRAAARENARIGVVCINEPMLHFVERFARSSMRRVADTLTADDLAFLSIATTEFDIKVVESQPSVFALKTAITSLGERDLLLLDGVRMFRSAGIKDVARMLDDITAETRAAIVLTSPSRPFRNRAELLRIGSANVLYQAADIVIGLHRPDMWDGDSVRPGEIELFVMKNRLGRDGDIVAVFQGHYMRITNLAHAPGNFPA